MEQNSPLMLGGFLFLAIFCPLPSPGAFPPAAAQLREPAPWLPGELSPRLSAQQALCCCDGICEAAAAAAARLRARLGSARLGPAPPPLCSLPRRAARLALALLGPLRRRRRLWTLLCCSCCWRGQRWAPRVPAQR